MINFKNPEMAILITNVATIIKAVFKLSKELVLSYPISTSDGSYLLKIFYSFSWSNFNPGIYLIKWPSSFIYPLIPSKRSNIRIGIII